MNIAPTLVSHNAIRKMRMLRRTHHAGGNGPCGQNQLLQHLKDGNSILAQITVNGDDQITTVKEIYHP